MARPQATARIVCLEVFRVEKVQGAPVKKLQAWVGRCGTPTAAATAWSARGVLPLWHMKRLCQVSASLFRSFTGIISSIRKFWRLVSPVVLLVVVGEVVVLGFRVPVVSPLGYL